MNDALARIDEEIDKLESQIAGLRYARTLFDGAQAVTVYQNGIYAIPYGQVRTASEIIADEEAALTKKPEREQTPAKSKSGWTPSLGKTRQVAYVLRQKGPKPAAELVKLTGMSNVTVAKCLQQDQYFVKTNPNNRLSPWTLTVSGRELASQEQPG